MPIYYDAYILKELGASATGINDSGWIVGYTEKVAGQPVSAWWIPTLSSGQGPAHNFIQGPAGTPGRGIDNLGNVILPNGTLFNILFNSNPSAGPLPFTTATVLNDQQMVVGGNVIYNWLTQQVVATMPFSDATSFAINNSGNVVGVGFAPNAPPDYGLGGFFYTAAYNFNYGGPPGQAYFGRTTRPLDINDNQISVGFILGGPPIAYWDNNQQQLTEYLSGVITLPYNNEQSSFAMAINNIGTIVGTAAGAPAPPSQYAFVAPAIPNLYNASPTGAIPAFDLNSLANKPTDWSLVAAYDINNPGSIVGQARGPGGRLAGFVANPRPAISQQPLRDLPDLDGLIGDSEARSPIRKTAAERASSGQIKRSAESTLAEAHKEQIAKVLKLLGRK